MTKTIAEMAMFFAVTALAGGQTAPAVTQTASQSPCANIVALSGARVDCNNLTTAQKKALSDIPAILRMAIENQGYLDAILKKLNEMSEQPTTTNTAAGGFSTSGGTLINPTVINTGPPLNEKLDPDSFYQLGQVVAEVSGAVPDLPNGRIVFDVIRPNRYLNASNDVQYRDLILHCSDAGKPLPSAKLPPGFFAGTVIVPAALGWGCQIVSKK